MFSSFIRRPNRRGGRVTQVGDHLTLSLRSNGSTGWVLVLGLFRHADGNYPSRKRPVQLRIQLTTKEGVVSEEALCVTDADGIHLSDASVGEVRALIASLKDVVVLSLS